MAALAASPVLAANLMLHLAIPLAHLAFLTGDPAETPVSEETLIARIREQFGFLGSDVKVIVSIRDGVAHIEIPPATGAKAEEATRFLERAAKRAREGDFARAAELYARVLKLNPALQPVYRELAMSLVELGRPEEAKDALIDALRLDPADAWSFVVLGNIYAKQQANLPRARQFFERALALKPADAWALNGLATVLAQTDDTAGALRRFDEAIAANPNFANAWLGKARVLSHSGHGANAADTIKAMFTRAQAQDARSEPVFAEAAKLFLSTTGELARAGESDAFKAVEDYRRTIERESGYPAEVVEGELPAHLAAQVQAAWKYGRDRHIVTVRKSPPPNSLRRRSRRTWLRTS